MNGGLRVALVRGPIVFGAGAVNNEATPAIAIAYIAGYLKGKGYDPAIVDAIGEGLNCTWPIEQFPGFFGHGLTFDQIIERLPDELDVIGISGMFSGEWPVTREMIKVFRKVYPDALIVAGGEHVTALTEYSLRDCDELDICVRGEGEHIFYELLESYGETGGYNDIDGISFIDSDGTYRENGGLPRIREVDEIPWPHWPEGYLEKFWAAGKSYGIATERDMPFMISRGCPYRCTFCSNEQMWTTRYILRDVEDVLKEVKHWIERYDITSVQLYDLTAITKKRWLVEFCHRLIEEGIEVGWSLPTGTRSEALDSESIDLLKKIGCTYLVYAPESGSPRTLELIKKRVDLDKLTASVLEARRQGMGTRINLIIGFPGESWGDVLRTLWFGFRMAVRGVDEAPVYVFSPYPGTEIFRNLQDAGEIELGDKFFFGLTSLNSAYLSTKVVSHNSDMPARLLGAIRLVFILTNYAVGYLVYPSRIVRTFRSLFGKSHSSTVFEHRLKDLMDRKSAVEG